MKVLLVDVSRDVVAGYGAPSGGTAGTSPASGEVGCRIRHGPEASQHASHHHT